MKHTQDIFSLILKQSPDLLLFVVDKEGTIILLSDAFKNKIKKTWDIDVEIGSNLLKSIQFDEDRHHIEMDLNHALTHGFCNSTRQYGVVDLGRKYFNTKWIALKENENIVGVACLISYVVKENQSNEKSLDVSYMFDMFFELSSDALLYTKLDLPVGCNDVLGDEKIVELLKNEYVVYTNQALLQQLQVNREDVIGKSLYELFDYPLNNVIREYKSILKNDRITIKTLERKSDGTDVWIEGNYVTLCDRNNQIVGHFGSRRDITKQVESEQAAQQSQYLLNYIIENDQTAVSVHDQELRYIYVSQKYLNEFGLENKDVISKKQEELFDDVTDYWKEVNQRALSGEIIKMEEATITINNVTNWYRWECRPWYDVDNNIGGIIVYVENITEEKRINAQLKENEMRLNALFTQAAIGISYGPVNHQLQLVNDKLARILGYTVDELSEKTYEDLAHPHDLNDYLQMHNKLINHEIDNFVLETRLLKKNKEIIWASVTFSLIMKDEWRDAYMLMMFEDITTRKQMEEKMIFLNYHDQLTGLYNRRYYEEELKRLDTARNLPMSLIVADANGLKLINDAFGHLQGDHMIKTIADVFVNECRSDDIIARIGGDEFVVLLPNTTKAEAQRVVARIQQRLEKESIHQAPVTVSLGVATKTEEEMDIFDVFNEAETHMYGQKLNRRSDMMISTIQVIIDTFFKENEYEKRHAHRVSELCFDCAKSLGLSDHDCEKIKVAGLMHDIGKVSISQSILNKVTKLTKSDWDEITRHSEIGYRILSAVGEFAEVSEYVLAHHERWDGKGYPKGLQGKAIPMASRIISVVDAFDTMINTSPYASSHSLEETLSELQRMRGTQFDPYVVDVFIQQKVYARFITEDEQ